MDPMEPNAAKPVDMSMSYLSHAERDALERARTIPALAPQLSAELFNLFLNGKSCIEIARLNNNKYHLGQIVRARVEFDWDIKKTEHTEALLNGVRDRVQLVQLESINYLSDRLAAAHKLDGDKFKKYLQSGKREDLEGLDGTLSNFKEYEKVLTALMNLTGQATQQKVTGEVTVKHVEVPAGPAPEFDLTKPLPAGAASKLLGLALADREKEKAGK